MKSDKATTLKHIQEIYTMMAQGANSIDIVEYGRINWKIKTAGMYKLIKIAFNYLAEKTVKDIDSIRLEANIRFDKLYTKLYKEGKYRDAGYIQSQKNKINGLEIQKFEHSGEIKTVDILDIFKDLKDQLKDGEIKPETKECTEKDIK
jgi:hypothetical protein